MTYEIRIEKLETVNDDASDDSLIYPVRLIRKRLWDGEIADPALRTNPSSPYQVQRTYDGGSTWVTSAADDPRHEATRRFPARTGSTRRCDAAANAVAVLKSYIDQVIAGASTLATVTWAIAGVFTWLIGADVIIDIFAAAVSALCGIGASTLTAAFTSGAYDTLTDILYCHMDANGQVSAAALATIQSDISAQLGSTVRTAFDYLMTGLGEVGLSNAGALGSVTGDCSGAVCCANWFAGYGGFADWTLWHGGSPDIPLGNYNSTDDRVDKATIAQGTDYASIHKVCSSISSIEVWFTVSFSGGTYGLVLYDLTTSAYIQSTFQHTSPYINAITGRDGHDILVQLSRGNSADRLSIDRVEICP
jgi:hypothetical protein